MLVPMAKVEMIGPKNRFYDVVSLLHEIGTLHIEDLSKKISTGEVPLDQMEVVENQLAEKERMEDLLLRLLAKARQADCARRSPPCAADCVTVGRCAAPSGHAHSGRKSPICWTIYRPPPRSLRYRLLRCQGAGQSALVARTWPVGLVR